MRCTSIRFLLAALIGSPLPAFAQPSGQVAMSNVVGLELADLMNIEITSVSKKEDKIATTAAAIFVLTGEEIRRSGVTNLPDALRLVPGLQVAQTNATTWAISSRGFNSTAANK